MEHEKHMMPKIPMMSSGEMAKAMAQNKDGVEMMASMQNAKASHNYKKIGDFTERSVSQSKAKV